MRRLALLTVLLSLALSTRAQTIFRISNVTITEKDQVIHGRDVHAEIVGSEGDDRLVMFDQNGVRVKAQCRIRTHDSRRSSVKDGAVYATFEIRLNVDGQKDHREVRKVFYGEQERKTRITEKFTIKRGIDVRVITVAFDGSLE